MVRAFVLFACAVAITCLGRASTPPIGVVVITLDTTRADRLTAYGFQDAEMPHLDRLAREGVVFDQATSVGPLRCRHMPAFLLACCLQRTESAKTVHPHSRSSTRLSPRSCGPMGFAPRRSWDPPVLNPDRGLSQGFEQYGGVAGGQGPRAADGPTER